MTRCPACSRILVSTAPHTRPGEDVVCDGTAALSLTIGNTTLTGEIFGIHPDMPLTWDEAIEMGHIKGTTYDVTPDAAERLAATPDIAPVKA